MVLSKRPVSSIILNNDTPHSVIYCKEWRFGGPLALSDVT